jgi:uncharacterized membrane protein
MKNKSSHLFLKQTLIFLLIVIFQFIVGFAFAQKGTIRGAIYEQSTGEPLYGVSVLVKESSIGSITDFDGKFEIQIAPGTYSLQISYISYGSVEIQQVEVKDGAVTVLNDVLMLEDVSELETVTVSAEQDFFHLSMPSLISRIILSDLQISN